MRPLGGETWAHRSFRWFGHATGVLIVFYLAFDRGGAHIHIPHTPAFLAELLLTFGVIVAATNTQWVRRALWRDPVLACLVGFMLWGLFRTVPNMAIFGVQNAVRDAALWYYGGFAILLVAAAEAVPELPSRLVRGFSRVLPWLTLWLPAALLLQRSGFRGPSLKYSNVPIFSHKPGNICVAAAILLLWLWLVPDPNRRPWVRNLLSVINLGTILLATTQTRGGGLAASVAIVFGLILLGRRRSAVIVGLSAGIVVALALGSISGFTYHTKTQRTISVSQLISNVLSVSGGESNNAQLSSTVDFRTSLWSTLLHAQVTTAHLVDGFGFGPNLATIGGITEKAQTSSVEQQLRSAHNSLLDILARTGLIGAFLWLLVWLSWYRRMTVTRRRLLPTGDETTRGVIAVCMVGCLTIMVNSFFDPTLEGAQVAVLNFSLLALGVIAARYPGIVSGPPTTTESAGAPGVRALRTPAGR